jgi:hypothetical protein
MSNSDKRVRDLPRSEYLAARRKAVRDEPRAEPAPSERPLPPVAMAMTLAEYEKAKRAITARVPNK